MSAPDRGEPVTWVFFRDGMFYPLTVPASDDPAAHAEANPGTLRIEDERGNIIWRPQ